MSGPDVIPPALGARGPDLAGATVRHELAIGRLRAEVRELRAALRLLAWSSGRTLLGIAPDMPASMEPPILADAWTAAERVHDLARAERDDRARP